MRGKHRIIGHSDLYTEKVIFNHSFEEKRRLSIITIVYILFCSIINHMISLIMGAVFSVQER